MIYPEIFIIVEITCPNQIPFVKRINFFHIAGQFDSGMVLKEIQKDYPDCRIQLNDIEWVLSKKH